MLHWTSPPLVYHIGLRPEQANFLVYAALCNMELYVQEQIGLMAASQLESVGPLLLCGALRYSRYPPSFGLIDILIGHGISVNSTVDTLLQHEPESPRLWITEKGMPFITLTIWELFLYDCFYRGMFYRFYPSESSGDFFSTVRLILRSGADLECRRPRNKRIYDILMYACPHEDCEALDNMLDDQGLKKPEDSWRDFGYSKFEWPTESDAEVYDHIESLGARLKRYGHLRPDPGP